MPHTPYPLIASPQGFGAWVTAMDAPQIHGRVADLLA